MIVYDYLVCEHLETDQVIRPADRGFVVAEKEVLRTGHIS